MLLLQLTFLSFITTVTKKKKLLHKKVVLMYVTILSLMKLQNYIVWWMVLHFLKLLVVSLFHIHFFLILCYRIFFWVLSESYNKTLKFQLTMELGLNSYMLTLKVTQINIITVAIVLVLLPKITILSVLNIFFFLTNFTRWVLCIFMVSGKEIYHY